MEEPDVHNLVKSVANKQQANKRKRDPDMYLDAVLECTVRRLKREKMEREEGSRKRRRITLREADETALGSCGSQSATAAPSPDHVLLNNLKTMDCSRTFIGGTITALDESECGKMDQHLDDELSGDLKELLDELAREFPGDFGLTDSNNNCSLMPSETGDCENDLWLSNIIEVLCSS